MQSPCEKYFFLHQDNVTPETIYKIHVYPNQMSSDIEEEFACCASCGNMLDNCQCVCPFCGERDKCECAVDDAGTGG